MSVTDKVEGVVQKVCLYGRHGPYAIATVEGVGSVTFSLEEEVWDEEDFPEEGEIVVLSRLRKKRAGWKAMAGRRYRLSDQKTK